MASSTSGRRRPPRPKRLSEPGVQKMKKAEPGKRREVYDTLAPGLSLRVTDKGTKSFACHYRHDGKHQRITLGEWPGLGVEVARTEARAIRKWVKAGIDPKIARKAERRAAIEARKVTGMTFGDLATKYIEQKIPDLANASRYEAVIRNRLVPAWGGLPLSELRGHDLSELVTQVKAEAGPMAAYRVYEVGKGVFSWALGASVRGVDFHPFAHVKAKHLSIRKVPRQRTLRDFEIALIWSALDGLGYPFGDWAKMLLLLGQRRSETAMMERKPGELDLDAGTWTIPAEKSKSRRAHLVPLPPEAVTILRGLPEFYGGKFAFSTSGGRRPISGFSRARSRLDEAVAAAAAEQGLDPIEPWVWHDARRTVSSGMARFGTTEVVRERVLNHLPQGLSATYNLYQFEREKRIALESWTRHVIEAVGAPLPV